MTKVEIFTKVQEALKIIEDHMIKASADSQKQLTLAVRILRQIPYEGPKFD